MAPIRRNPGTLRLLARAPVVPISAARLRELGIAPQNPNARTTGQTAKRSGRAFEREIEAANGFYEGAGVAVVYRNHPPVEGWGRSLHVTGRGPADFSGVAVLLGRPAAIAFDCKVVTGSASYRHAERDRHQLESLLRFRSAGGRAFLLLLCRELDRVWLLENLDTLERGERVDLRRRIGGEVRHLLPVLVPSSNGDVARGIAPRWPYLRLLAGG